MVKIKVRKYICNDSERCRRGSICLYHRTGMQLKGIRGNSMQRSKAHTHQSCLDMSWRGKKKEEEESDRDGIYSRDQSMKRALVDFNVIHRM